MAKEIKLPDKTPIPQNWCWVDMGNLTDTKCGYPFDSQRFNNCVTDARPLIRIRDVTKGYTETYTDEDCPDNFIIHRGEILIGMDGDFNVEKWNSEDALLNQRVCCIKSSSDLLLNNLLYYYLPEPLKKINDATPSVTVKHLSVKTLTKTPLPLPPLAEQQRIVDRIERLFAKLDEAKEKAQAALDSFETRKAAILHKAFTGELTAKWREENGVGMESWVKNLFEQVADIKSNLVSPLDYPQYPHIAPDNIEKRTGKLLEYRTVLEDNVISGKHRFYAGQILYSKIRPYLSKVVMVDFDGLCSADMYPIEAKEDTKYLWYYMLSDGFLEQASSAGSRSVLPKINQKELASLYVIRPSINEQKQIVCLLDSFFAKEQKAKELCSVLDNIDLIKKSILARAFRGELGTNDPTEESAVELLKSIV